jgi:hypothetical protein
MRETFQALRAETGQAGCVPDFDSTLAEARRRAAASPALQVVQGGTDRTDRAATRRRLVRAAGTSVVLAASVAGLLLMTRAPSGEDDFERLVAAYASVGAGGAWSSPTQALLDVPGRELMRSVPSIGGPVRGIDRADLPPRPTPEEVNR